MEKHINRKIQYTRKAIKESYLTLLEKKERNRISVTELTELADINRATFYAHYQDIDTLSQEIEREMAQHVVDAMENLYAIDLDKHRDSIIDDLFAALVENKEMCVWFMDDQSTGSGSRYIYDYAKRKYIPVWKRYKEMTDVQAEQFLAFIYNGAYGFVKNWYQSGFVGDMETVKSQLKELIHVCLSYIPI